MGKCEHEEELVEEHEGEALLDTGMGNVFEHEEELVEEHEGEAVLDVEMEKVFENKDMVATIVELLEIKEVFLVVSRINCIFCIEARERIERVRPTLERLMSSPFNFRLRQGLSLTHLDFHMTYRSELGHKGTETTQRRTNEQ